MPVQTRGAKRKAKTLVDDPPSTVTPNARPRKVQIKDSAAAAPQPSLFGLPGELRNAIYRYSLVQENRVVVSPGLSQPGLLQVSRQLRAESINVYYQENTFKHTIRDYDTKTYRKWYRSSPLRTKCKTVFRTTGSTNWANLLEWLRADFHQECSHPGPRPDGDPTLHGSIFNMVKRMRRTQRLSWVEVAANLEDVHQGLVAVNPAWA